VQINQYIDHTLLKPTALIEDIKRICSEAVQYKFACSMCAATHDQNSETGIEKFRH
jgi:deoxyribose-phosphate aldolase